MIVLKGRVIHSTVNACSSESHFFFFKFCFGLLFFGFFLTETFELGSSPLEALTRSSESSNHMKQLFPLIRELLTTTS